MMSRTHTSAALPRIDGPQNKRAFLPYSPICAVDLLNDYVYGGIVNPSLNSDGKELDGYEDNGNYEELLRYCEAHGIKNYLTEILYYIVHPNEVIFEEGCK